MSTNQERIIKVVQSSTKRLVDSFLEKSGRLSNNIQDIKNLLREGYDTNIAFKTAKALFGSEKVKFLAIDGTVSEDQRLDILIFKERVELEKISISNRSLKFFTLSTIYQANRAFLRYAKASFPLIILSFSTSIYWIY